MDHMEMVEKLREKTGLSYEEARAALERADWNLLDALIALEKEGKVQGGSGRYSTDEAQTAAPNDRTDSESFGDMMRRFGRWLQRLFHKGNINQLCMDGKDGAQALSIPVTLFVLLLLVAFWVVLPLMIIALFCGCRFRFRGPDLGRESVNKVMDKATEVADTIKAEVRGDATENR